MTNDELTRLLPLVRTGDERACEQLWHGLNIPIYTVALRILDDRALAEDVTQEVFVKLFTAPPTEDVKNPRAWIFRVTHNAALNCLERQRVRASLPLEDAANAAVHEDHGGAIDMAAALGRLDPLSREIVTLHAVADASFREIADAVGLKPGTVYFKYRRAIARLREWLS